MNQPNPLWTKMNRKSLVRITALLLAMGFLAVLAYIGKDMRLNSNPAKSSNFLERESDYYIPDKIVGHIHRPYAVRTFDWKEHEKGRLVFRTNNLGFREDHDTEQGKPLESIRVLVTGDSHIDGVLYNSESFPNLLETDLNSRFPPHKFEVINGGTGYYGPHNYARFLDKYLSLKPDIFVVVIYAGNDFLDAGRFLEAQSDYLVKRPKDYYKLLHGCCQGFPGVGGQVFNQIHYLKTFPHMQGKVVGFTNSQLAQIHEICLRNGIELFVVLLPTKADVEWQTDRVRLEKARVLLGWTLEDLHLNQRLSQQVAGWLKQKAIKYIDVYAKMTQTPAELFWRYDYHLNNKGHAFLAKILAPSLQPYLETLIAKEG